MKRLVLLAAALVAGACASTPVTPLVVRDTVYVTRAADVRPAVRPVVPTQAFQHAVERRTRTTTGEPGARYWQQRVQYRIDAELDPATALVRGQEQITYRNNSPDTLRTILLHLYQNAFSEGVQRVRRVPMTGGTRVQRVVVDRTEARQVQAAGADGAARSPSYRIDGTLMWIELVRPLVPGGTLALDLEWQFTVPPQGAPRTGHARHEVYVVAQWYPQVAVYDDLRGWHDRPYWTNGEFYLEYGDFDVALTVPEGWLVTATGELDNADEVLRPDVRERLRRALVQDSIVRVVTADDVEQGNATLREMGGQLTWRYRASNVRDFAFATSNRYLWDATRVLLPDANGDGRDELVRVDALYRPEAGAWVEAARYMRHAIAFHARRWGPYIYPKIAAAEGPIGGMEYPMLVFIGAPTAAKDLYAVLSHEIAHEWWPMMVGSNETLYAWQDEGLATYVEDLSVRDYFADANPALATQDAYLRLAGSDAELPIMTAPDLFGIGPQYGVAAYTKPGSLLRALGGLLGQELVQRALREYTTRWLLRHPSPYDFFNTVEALAEQDLDWFWSPWFYETAVFDQAIRHVQTQPLGTGERLTITVEDVGGAPLPVRLMITMEDGATREVRMSVDAWLAGVRVQTITADLPVRAARVEIDPARLFPDVDRRNNVWEAVR
ncbi:MAG TPA: M1 family metallopeptidase [Longimicrobiales bacterium]|nr:M1 family metallopeptidase [Longimicrobiales bacterium]